MKEFETKILLTKDEYFDIISIFGKTSEFKTQINYYYDTPKLSMDKQGTTCRIRYNDGEYKATIKKHGRDGNTEQDLGCAESLTKNYFTNMGLELMGELVTHRMLLFKNDIIEAVIDRNEYAGTTDYELEIEYKEGFEKSAISIVKCLSFILFSEKNLLSAANFVLRTKNTETKSHRFFKRSFK